MSKVIISKIEATVDGVEAIHAELNVRADAVTERFLKTVDPDLQWSFTDAGGHFHAWTKEGKLLTVQERREHIPCDNPDCTLSGPCEGNYVVHQHCLLCDEEIEPGRIVRHDVTVTLGMRYSWEATVRQRAAPERNPLSERVSAHFRLPDGREFFGLAHVANWSVTAYDFTMNLVGVGELGERATGAVPCTHTETAEVTTPGDGPNTRRLVCLYTECGIELVQRLGPRGWGTPEPL